MSDLYQRPDREAIAARVRAAQPQPGALECFTAHLSARMRLLGWEQAALQERASISPQLAAKAINGTGVSLELAEKLAGLVGLTLATMISRYSCSTCSGEPPAGFACLECGAEGSRTAGRDRLDAATAEAFPNGGAR